MFSIFKKQEVRAAEKTFKQRVGEFWDWYSREAPRFYQVIEERNSANLATEVSNKVDELGPGFAWVFGPGAKNGHSFTLSGEGVLHKQLLTQYWLSRAPNLDGWTFYSERQPGPIEGIRIKVGDQDFNAVEFWITPQVNCESEKIDITAWHPLFDRLEQSERMMPLFLFLDEVLGEFGTDNWIGEIKLNDKRLPEAIPLKELPGFIADLQKTKDWKKFPPGGAITLYRCQNPHMRFPRGDIIIGQTRQTILINEYLKAEGRLKDPLEGTGADYVFVSFDAGFLPKGKQVEVRGAIEDALDKVLRAEHRGRLLGGALGTNFAYIDLLIYDGAASLETVQRVLKEHQLPAGTAINFFTEEKRERSWQCR
jgi:hypothetical protein